MKKNGLLFYLLLLTTISYSQKVDLYEKQNQILEEGKYLYRLELSSWHASDILLKDYKKIYENVAAYCSYMNNDTTIAIFWDQSKQILLTIEFFSTPDLSNANVSSKQRKATDYEENLIDLRNSAIQCVIENNDDFFSFYENINFNFIPIINSDSSRTVFIISASSQADDIVIGNDYKLVFNTENELVEKYKLHNSLIKIDVNGQIMDSGKKVGSIHSHVLEDQPFITSTDICSFLLYKDFIKLSNHVVVSENYICIFDVVKETLMIVPKSFK